MRDRLLLIESVPYLKFGAASSSATSDALVTEILRLANSYQLAIFCFNAVSDKPPAAAAQSAADTDDSVLISAD